MASVDNAQIETNNTENIRNNNIDPTCGQQQMKHPAVIAADKSLNPAGFIDYIFKNPSYKWFIRIGILSIIIEFFVFKYFYPYAGYINGDSYIYLETAYHNFFVNTYPIGYSKFLRLISIFTYSDTVVVAIQYLLLQLSTLSLVFTIFYFYTPKSTTKALMFGFMLFNPVYLYLSNYISSDALFLSLSLTWFTLLVWIMNRPSNKLIFINATVLFLAFTVRYNALFYPAVGIAALALSKRKILINIIGFGLSMLLIWIFIEKSSSKYIEISGHNQFTPFSGWQIANNALYAYRYVDSVHVKAVPDKLKNLDKMVRNYFDTSRNIKLHPEEALVASTVYMWAKNSPLTIYMENQFKNDSTASALKKWATVAPTMKEYGSFLIKTYPTKFIQYYIVPNAIKYYAPPVEFLDHYSTGIDSVNEVAKVWFDYKSTKLKTRVKDYKVNILNYYPILTGSMNVLFLLSLASFIFLKGYRKHKQLKRGLVLVIILWAVNFGFSVFASPIALRFQLFPITIYTIFTFLLMEYLILAAWNKEPEVSVTDGL